MTPAGLCQHPKSLKGRCEQARDENPNDLIASHAFFGVAFKPIPTVKSRCLFNLSRCAIPPGVAIGTFLPQQGIFMPYRAMCPSI